MAVTNAQIRDLLNRPRGLNEGTITEYITVRTNEVNKRARGTQYLATDSANKVSDALKDDAIKMLELVKIEDPDSDGGLTMIFQENKTLKIKIVDGKLVSEFV